MSRIFFLLGIFVFVVLLYASVFSVYFSQDDFFMFRASLTNGSVSSFLHLFAFLPFQERGYAFYRPIFREALHSVYYLNFGLNPLPMRILLMLIHLVNITLTYLLISKIFKNWKIGLFAAFFFGITSAHIGTLTYLAGGMEVAGATSFVLTAILMFLSYFEKQRLWKLIFAFTLFLLSLASHELAAVTPLIIVGLVLIQTREKRKRFLGLVTPLFAVLAIYIYLDVFHIGFLQHEQQYRPSFHLNEILNSYAWYVGWSLGLPEMLLDFVGPGLHVNPNLMQFWGGYFKFIFPAFFTAVLILVSCSLYLFIKHRNIFKQTTFWFLIFWFPVSLSPIILLPLHKSTHYLSPALPAFWAIIGFITLNTYWQMKKVNKTSANILLITLVSALVILSVVSVKLADKTYPAINRGRIAQKVLNDIKKQYPQLPKGAVILIKNDPSYPKISGSWGGSSNQAEIALNGSDALQLLYNDTTLKVYYEDLHKLPVGVLEKDIYSVVANISF